MLRYLYYLLRIILLPVVFLLVIIFPKVKRRWKFDGKETLSFNSKIQADCAFEVSSEGELEQVQELIKFLLKKGKKIQLIYCSESVEKDCLKLQNLYKGQVNLLSLPVLKFLPFIRTLNPLLWINSNHLVLCRYDFFPELILFATGRLNKLYLVSATLKNFKEKPFVTKLYLKYCYKNFHKIIAPTNKNKTKIVEYDLNKNVESFDFRIPRIIDRINKGEDTINENFPGFSPLFNHLKSGTDGQRLIFGSFWNSQIDFLNKIDLKNRFLAIAPHQLSDESFREFSQKFEKEIFYIDENSTKEEILKLIDLSKETEGVWYISVKGILCELYQYFDLAYIDGGFGISVHSLLEPYLSGCHVYCGPKVHRSTEYDWIKDIDQRMQVSYNSEKELWKKINQDYNLKNRGLFKRSSVDEIEAKCDWLRII